MELQSVPNTQHPKTNNQQINPTINSEEIKEEKQSIIHNDNNHPLQYQQLQRTSKYTLSDNKPMTVITETYSTDCMPITIQLADSNNKIVKYYQYKNEINMQLDYGFRSIYEMYRFNKRPLIYVILSILSVYIPSLIFPKGNRHKLLLFYIYLSFTIINAFIILVCLAKAILAIMTGNDHTETQIYQHNRHTNSTGHITYASNPTDDPLDNDDSVNGLYIYEDCSDDEMHIPNTQNSKTIIRDDTVYSTSSTKRKHSMVAEKTNVITKLFYKFGDQFNALFDIRAINSRIQSKIAPSFSGFLLVFSVLCCQILLTAVTRKFKVGIFELLCSTEDSSSEESGTEIDNGQCLSRKAAILNCNSMSAATLLIAFALFQEISFKAQKRKLERRAKIREECESNGIIQNIETKINNSVCRWIFDQLTFKAMFKSLIWQTLLCGIAVCYHGISFGYYSNANKIAMCFSIFGKINIVINGVILLNTAQRFVTQYRYILIVMRQFSKPIYTKCIDDIIAWWQYRRYYREYEIKTFANVFHPMVSWLLLLTIVCVLYIAIIWIIAPRFALTADEHIMMLIVAYFCYIVLYLCELAVRTHQEQRERNCGILDREIIHCKRNLSGRIDLSLIMDIKTEIWNNSKPIVLVGIPMKRSTIVALRTYFGGAVATLILDWYFSEKK